MTDKTTDFTKIGGFKHSWGRFEHIFNEDSVTHGGIIDQNVGNSSYQLPVLYKGTSAHADVK